jgi:hypothetical protein
MNTRVSILFFIAAFAVLASCKNNDNVFPKKVSTALNVINASGDVLNFYINGTRQNNTTIISGGQSFYLPVPAGTQNYQFKISKSTDVLFSVPLTLRDSVNNSLYVTEATTSRSFSTIDVLDTTGINLKSKAKIRFVNASPDAGDLNVTVGSKVSFTAISYKITAAFALVDAGLTEMKVNLAGSNTAKIDTSITLQAGHMYTLFSKGLLAGKGNARFNVGFALNF